MSGTRREPALGVSGRWARAGSSATSARGSRPSDPRSAARRDGRV